jgi:hypothetical protein
MNKNWQTNLGGAFAALGTTLMGIGIIPQLSGVPSQTLTYVAIAGFFCNGLGVFFGHLFSADANTVKALQTQVDQNSAALISGDTSFIKQPVASTPAAAAKIATTLVLLASLALGIGSVVMVSGCNTSQQRVVYNTLYTVEHTTSTAVDAYYHLVIVGTVTTNGVPKVSAAFNHFQASFLIALDAAQFNTNAIAPDSLNTESGDIINLITTIKNGGSTP